MEKRSVLYVSSQQGAVVATEHVFDRRIRFDERSRGWSIADVVTDPVPRSYTWNVGRQLDQGHRGACVGHSWVHELVARPAIVALADSQQSAFDLYHDFQHDDQWAGCSLGPVCPKFQTGDEQYEGSSVLAGARVLHRRGVFTSYRWAFTLAAVCGWVPRGPVVLGLWWYAGMLRRDFAGFIHPTGVKVGGHAILMRGQKIVWLPGTARTSFADVDLNASYAKLWQSWGADGDWLISLRELGDLLADDGECCIPMGRRTQMQVDPGA